MSPTADILKRFTLDGSDTLEGHLRHTCSAVRQHVTRLIPERRIEALLLGGGYGRGEGGVLRTSAGDQPYNDLEFYLCLDGLDWHNEQKYAPLLRRLGEQLSPSAGMDVEFKVTSLKKLCASSITMFSYDLVLGHQWIIGDEKMLAGCEHHWCADRIPLHEATRLMMNRCSGLLFARGRLGRDCFTPEDADFVGRNLAKARLALGDVILTALGQYHWSCRERRRRIHALKQVEGIEQLPSIQAHHAAGVAFKLNPVRCLATREELAHLHSELVRLADPLWNWLESRRLGYPFTSPQSYALSDINKCPETPAWHNVLINLRAYGPRALRRKDAWRYPREKLLQSLRLLLWENELEKHSLLLRFVQQELRTQAGAFQDLVDAYQRLWHRFN